MNLELLKVRLIAFFYEAIAMIITALLATLGSEEFAALIMTHFGDTVWGGLIVLAVSGAVKHARNLKILKDQKLGAVRGGNKPFHLV